MDINKLIKEEINKFLLNEMSSLLYHVTDIPTLIKIMRYDTMKLSKTSDYIDRDIEGVRDINGMINGEYKYYLSFTRQPNMKFGYSQYFLPMKGEEGGTFMPDNGAVRIAFDGYMLANNFKGKPVDFYSVERRTSDDSLRDSSYKGLNTGSQDAKVQNEDRLFSNRPYIDDISKYIISVDVFPVSEEERNAVIDAAHFSRFETKLHFMNDMMQ